MAGLLDSYPNKVQQSNQTFVIQTNPTQSTQTTERFERSAEVLGHIAGDAAGQRGNAPDENFRAAGERVQQPRAADRRCSLIVYFILIILFTICKIQFRFFCGHCTCFLTLISKETIIVIKESFIKTTKVHGRCFGFFFEIHSIVIKQVNLYFTYES